MFRCLWTALFVSVCGSTALSATRPNIVVILCDDLGYGDLECYGHPHIKTPHLNNLADEGILLTNCYAAAPVCSPSRVGLLTGRIPNRAGVYDWIPPARNGRPDARDQVHMRASEVTIAKLLNNAGYATCMAGKWHCNSRFNQTEQPQPGDFGFEHWFGTQNNAAPSHRNPQNFVRNGSSVGKIEGFSCQLVVDEAIGWLKNKKDDRPFFLYLPFHEPHEPVASPKKLVDQYREVAENENQAQYFANVANVDAAAGRLLNHLQQNRLRENTIVFFTSDNGPETLNRYRGAQRSYGVPGPLRGMKLHTHEAGFRVAGIASWPDKIQAKQNLDTPISALDLLPTLCAIAKTAPPQSLALDGENILPILLGKKLNRDGSLFWCYLNSLNKPQLALRNGKWKMLAELEINGNRIQKLQNVIPETKRQLQSASLGKLELYDLSSDLGEDTNLIDKQQAVASRLKQEMEKRYRELIATSHVWVPHQAP